jgi:hypothetical protein
VLVEGLRRAGPDITREAFIDAIDSLSSFSLGGTTISFSPRDHQGMESVFFSVLRGGRFELVNDFRTVLTCGQKAAAPLNSPSPDAASSVTVSPDPPSPAALPESSEGKGGVQ